MTRLAIALLMLTSFSLSAFGTEPMGIEAQPYRAFKMDEIKNQLNGNPADRFLIVILGADWCTFCHALSKNLDKVVTSKSITVLKIDVDKSEEVADFFATDSVPNWIIYKGNNIVYRNSGNMSSIDLRKVLEKLGVVTRPVQL